MNRGRSGMQPLLMLLSLLPYTEVFVFMSKVISSLQRSMLLRTIEHCASHIVDCYNKAIFFAAICWCSTIRASDVWILNKLKKKTGSLLRTVLEPWSWLYKGRCCKRSTWTTLCTPSVTQWANNNVCSVRGFFSSAAEKNITCYRMLQGQSCSQQPLCSLYAAK